MIKKIKDIALQLKNWLKKKVSKSWTCYRHIKDISLDKFIVAHCDNDLSVLVISGKPNEEQLQKCWDRLYKQYLSALDGGEMGTRLRLIKDFVKLEGQVQIASFILELYGIEQAKPHLVNLINKFGYTIGKATLDNLDTVVQQFEGYLKADIVRLEGLRKKLDSEDKEYKPKVSDYYDIMVAIAEALKVIITPNKVSVLQYVAFANQYKRHIDHLIKQNK